MLLVARLRSDHPLGAVPLTYDDSDDTFVLEGVGEITAGKVLDLEDRRQLVWHVDEATRERVLASATARIRRDRAAAKHSAAARAAGRRPAASDARGRRRSRRPRQDLRGRSRVGLARPAASGVGARSSR